MWGVDLGSWRIIEKKILETHLKEISQPKEKKRTFGKIKEGMQKRRKELIEQGIIQPPIKYNKENYRSPLEEMSRKARKDEIQRLEDQRNKLKSGCQLGDDMKIKIKDLKLRMPEDKFKRKKSGFI